MYKQFQKILENNSMVQHQKFIFKFPENEWLKTIEIQNYFSIQNLIQIINVDKSKDHL